MSLPHLAPSASGLVFGRVPPPASLRDDYIDKPAGWAALGPRVIRGVCLHRTLGGAIEGTGEYFRTFDARHDDGGHGWNALTDWGIGLDGLVLRWNADGHRAPHANGPLAAPNGDAPAFIARYGAAAVNRDLESIELEGLTYDSPVTAALLTSATELIAWRIDRAMIPWHVWPKNRDGLQAIYWHGEFGPKDCPGPVVRARTDELIERVRARLRLSQLQTGTGTGAGAGPGPGPGTGSTPAPAPIPPGGPLPPTPIIPGLDHALARAWFGSVVAGGRAYTFDPDGPVSRIWLTRGRQTGCWPPLAAVESHGDRRYFRFADGLTVWTSPSHPAAILGG